jgi:hypothetical protein
VSAGGWKVVLEPKGANPDGEGRNTGGLVVSITDGTKTEELSRVAFVRRHSKNPTKTFKAQLKAEIEKAEEAAGALNNLIGQGSAGLV